MFHMFKNDKTKASKIEKKINEAINNYNNYSNLITSDDHKREALIACNNLRHAVGLISTQHNSYLNGGITKKTEYQGVIGLKELVDKDINKLSEIIDMYRPKALKNKP